MFDVPPPENDDEAIKLGNKIRDWIKRGRLDPGRIPNKEDSDDDDDYLRRRYDDDDESEVMKWMKNLIKKKSLKRNADYLDSLKMKLKTKDLLTLAELSPKEFSKLIE